MNKMCKKVVSLLLAAVMVLTMTAFASVVYAADEDSVEAAPNFKMGVILVGDETEGYSAAHIAGIKEAAAELLLEAKGFENVIVNLTGETADIVVPEADLSDAKRAQIEDIVKRKTGIAPENIVITPLNESMEDSADETASMSTSVDIDDDTP